MLVDVYAVLDAFGVVSHPIAHAIKKLLCLSNGVRTDKADQKKDLQEAIDALYRAQEQMAEVQAFQLPVSNVRLDNNMVEILKGPPKEPGVGPIVLGNEPVTVEVPLPPMEVPDWQKKPWNKDKITPPEDH